MDIVDIINDMEEEAEKAKKEFKGVDLTKLGEEAYFLEAKIAEKDLAWALQLARSAGVALPVGSLVSQSMARLYGVDDIRMFYENDLRFLEQVAL